jgi:hypothetical protein
MALERALRTQDISPELNAAITEQMSQGMTQEHASLVVRALHALGVKVEIDQAEKVTPAIEDARLEEDGSITLRLRSTSDGTHVSGLVRYKTTDERYKGVLEHLGGLKPGEVKLVPPWEE